MKFRAILTSINEKILKHSSFERKIKYLRKKGVKIGQNCLIYTMSFSTEPYLIEIGDRVGIGADTKFITHEGSLRCFGDNLDGYLYGRIKIGNNVFVGINCIILLNTSIGNNCIIGAGSVVRGHFPDNSVIMGNPAKVVLNMNIQKMLVFNNPGFVRMHPNPTTAEKDIFVKKHFGIE
jgi:acetyltransferase-like isoleucine patch superfamily enzyme